MTTYAGAEPELDLLFMVEEHDDVYEARRRVQREIFSALTEVVSGQGVWSKESAARIRAEGRAWARHGGAVDDLLAMLRTMTRRLINRCTVSGHNRDSLGHEVMVLRLGDASRRVGRELSCGFFEDGDGRDAPPSEGAPAGRAPAPSGTARAVLAVRAPSCTVADIEAVFRGLAHAQVLEAAEGAYVLVEAGQDRQDAAALARRAHQDLPGDVWIAMHWLDAPPETPREPGQFDEGGLSVVDGIGATLLALGCPPGVYGLDDVLVEYSAAATPAVSERLVKMVEPLREEPVLWDTLTALIAADGVRHRACQSLGIHRNTLDRRLQRIALLTGQRPERLSGLATLRAALAVVAVTRLRRSARLAGSGTTVRAALWSHQPHPLAPPLRPVAAAT